VKLIFVGPGRAGGSLALAASRVGHRIVGVLSRSDQPYGPDLRWDQPLPEADLLLITVTDGAIEEVAQRLAPRVDSIRAAAHVSGFTPITALGSLAAAGVVTGGFHPLQTLPDPERGAAALHGAYVGIGGDSTARATLEDLARSLGMTSFTLRDEARPGYHAGAAAASNFVITALATAGDLMRAAGVEAEVARPLVEQTVANVFEAGAPSSLTGPIARGDTATVIGQLAAAAAVSEDVGDQYRLMAEATAIRAGRRGDTQSWR